MDKYDVEKILNYRNNVLYCIDSEGMDGKVCIKDYLTVGG